MSLGKPRVLTGVRRTSKLPMRARAALLCLALFCAASACGESGRPSADSGTPAPPPTVETDSGSERAVDDAALFSGEVSSSGEIVYRVLAEGAVAPTRGPGAAPGNDCPVDLVAEERSFVAAMDVVADSVFQLFLDPPGVDEPRTGTAFYIGDEQFLTAEHLVRTDRTVRLVNGDRAIEAEVVASSSAADVALLAARDREAVAELRALTFGDTTDLRPGQEVASVGYPLMVVSEPSITRGIVSRVYNDPELGMVMQTDASINIGSSGGPIIDTCGNVVGMTVAKWYEQGVEGIAWAVLETTLRSALIDLRGQSAVVGDGAGSGATADSGMGLTTDPENDLPLVLDSLGEAVPAPQHYLLSAIDGLLRFYLTTTNLIIEQYNNGLVDQARAELEFRELAADAGSQYELLLADDYDLRADGASCDLARLAYADAVESAGFRALSLAEQLSDYAGQHESQGAAWRSIAESAHEAVSHAADCGSGR